MSPPRTKTDQDDVQSVADALEDEVAAIREESIGAKSNLVSNVFGGAVTVTLNHGLGRTPTGWITTDLSGSVGVGAIVDRSAWDANTITFRASAACTFAALVF